MLVKRNGKKPHIFAGATQLQIYDFSYEYADQAIHYRIWLAGHNVPVKTVLFLGAVQIGKLPAWVAQNCPDGTAVVQGAPHWLASDDGSDIPAFMDCFTKEAFARVLASFPCNDELHIIAESQAAPCVVGVLAANSDYASRVRLVALLQPLGLNSASFGSTIDQRSDTFKRRTAKNLRHQIPALLHDSRLRYNHRQMLRIVGYDNTKSNAQYGTGLACDASADLQRLHAMSMPMVIVSGGNDMLFPPHEIRATLARGQLDIPLVIVPGIPHSPLAAKQGLRLFRTALNYIGSTAS